MCGFLYLVYDGNLLLLVYIYIYIYIKLVFIKFSVDTEVTLLLFPLQEIQDISLF